MSVRFVILHHVTAGGEHWDLMLEYGGVLRTWQLLREPFFPAIGPHPRPLAQGERGATCLDALPIPARRIGDHRLAYLTYEGPLSGDRGRVTRVDEGTYSASEAADGSLSIRLAGRRLRGEFRLSPIAPGSEAWKLERTLTPALPGGE